MSPEWSPDRDCEAGQANCPMACPPPRRYGVETSPMTATASIDWNVGSAPCDNQWASAAISALSHISAPSGGLCTPPPYLVRIAPFGTFFRPHGDQTAGSRPRPARKDMPSLQTPLQSKDPNVPMEMRERNAIFPWEFSLVLRAKTSGMSSAADHPTDRTRRSDPATSYYETWVSVYKGTSI